MAEAATRLTGTIKRYFEEKGYGFIAPEEGGKELFIHVKAIKRGFENMREGATVEYEIGYDREQRPRAVRAVVEK